MKSFVLTMYYRDQPVIFDVTKTADGLFVWTCRDYPITVEDKNQTVLVEMVAKKLDKIFDAEGIASNELKLEPELKKYDLNMV
jgi:hypothetical protein